MPLQATSGAASQDAFGGNGVAVVPTYIEDVMSSWLYTGNSSTQTITNGIDLSTKGGLVWVKDRSATSDNGFYDTTRGVNKVIYSNLTNAESTLANSVTAFNTTGFSLGTDSTYNWSGDKYVSWTFRKQPKFFDVVTFTKSSSSQVISHNLNSTAGCIFIKRTDSTGGWLVAHRGYTGGITAGYTLLNATNAFTSSANAVTAADSTSFTLGSDVANGDFVAYLFAHDAGGFGLTGTDNVISCGSYTGDATSGVTVSLGYEPQWLMIKNTTTGNSNAGWYINDNMRGLPAPPSLSLVRLQANTSGAEETSASSSGVPQITATGFNLSANSSTGYNNTGDTYIYIAIRRGPMKVPTTGTSVFAPVTGNFSSPYTVTTNFPVDLTISSRTAGATRAVNDRLRGGTTNSYVYLNTASTAAESTGTGAGLGFQSNTAVIDTNWQTGGDALWWNFRRAPSFMDVVCYTGTSSVRTVAHNLGVPPELIIAKNRTGRPSNDSQWQVYDKFNTATNYMILNGNAQSNATSGAWNNTEPTSSVFTLGTLNWVNVSGEPNVAYLFATCAGVSKVGSYTGTGATQTINCGFGAGGARFALIKRTDSTGDWWVWDSARGMVSGTDPRIDLNAGNPQTNANWVYTISTGFQIVTTDASVNASGGTYIFLAIA